MTRAPWIAGLSARLIEVAHDWRYSDEYLGNIFRGYVGRSPCSCYEAGRDPLCRVHGATAGAENSQERPE